MLLLSKTFHASGEFTGADSLVEFSNPRQEDGKAYRFIRPWEAFEIRIHCVDIAPINTPDAYYFFAGNSHSPDVMRWWPGANPIPAGHWFPLPAAPGGELDYLDCHCNGVRGARYELFYTVYYTAP